MSEKSSLWPPPAQAEQVYVTVSALEGGMLTLFEKYFVSPADPTASALAPSMSFLVSHHTASPFPRDEHAGPFRMLFDLGLRSGIDKYVPGIQEHIRTRIKDGGTYAFKPGVIDSLQQGDVSTTAIDAIMLSHIHWDHHGDTSPFVNAKIIVGPGALAVLRNGVPNPASHMHFDPDSVPFERTLELPAAGTSAPPPATDSNPACPRYWTWQPLGPVPAALDFFRDGSVYVINAPGHLMGHVNLLCRVGPGRWVYLGGDACHDMRLLTGERDIATWKGEDGRELCIHQDKSEAAETIKMIRALQRCVKEAGESLEVVVAHDHAWYYSNRDRFLPGIL